MAAGIATDKKDIKITSEAFSPGGAPEFQIGTVVIRASCAAENVESAADAIVPGRSKKV
jgi:hypothetical protein